MESRLTPGTVIDPVTSDELGELIGRYSDLRWDRAGAGVRIRRFVQGTGASVGPTASYVLPYTPEPGYAWAAREIGIRGQLTTHIVSIGDTTSTTGPTNLVIASNTPVSSVPVFQFSGTQLVLWPGEYLVFSTSGATVLTSITLEVAEVPAQELWKLV